MKQDQANAKSPPPVVLVVEDEFLIALEAQQMLLELGATEVLLASSTAEAERLLAERPDLGLVVLDLLLGDAHAGELADAVRARGLPLVIASGLRPEDGHIADVPTVVKPYTVSELATAIGAAVRRTT